MVTVVTLIIEGIHRIPKRAIVTAGRVLLALPDDALALLSGIATEARNGVVEAEVEMAALATHIWQRENRTYAYYRSFGPLLRLATPTLLDLVDLEVARRRDDQPEDLMLAETLSERAWWQYMTVGAAERLREVLSEGDESLDRH